MRHNDLYFSLRNGKGHTTMIGLEKFDNLISLITYFKDNETCKRFLKEQRWGDDVVCPYCGHHHCRARSNGQFRCPNCLNNFSVLVGTIFENTKIALVKWFSVMYLISSHKKGFSSHQLARDISVTRPGIFCTRFVLFTAKTTQ